MSTLSVFNEDGIEVVIDKETGESFCTQAGYIRMSGKPKTTISDRITRLVRIDGMKEAELLTRYGKKLVRLIPAQLAFKWLLDDNRPLALKMGEAGATLYFHQLAGYKVTSNLVPQQQSPISTPILTLAQEAASLAEIVARIAGVSPSLASQMAVNAAIAVTPLLETARDSLKRAIACTDTIPDALLNVTDVGKLINLGPIRVNQLLIEKGLQFKTDDRKTPYRPTEEGKRYGRIVPALAKKKDQTVFQLRWMPEVASIIKF